MKIIVSFFVLLTSMIVVANDKATILQMKGRKAIVFFEKDIPFSVGQKVFLSSAEGDEIGMTRDMRNMLERQNSVAVTASYSSLKTESAAAVTNLEVSGRYGWNKQQFEFGPIVDVEYEKTAVETTNLSFGGYFDYNLVENVPGQDLVYGAYADLLFGSNTTKTSATSTTTSPMTIDLGGQAKWFGLSQVLALRVDLVYRYSTVKSIETTGFVLGFGLQHYY